MNVNPSLWNIYKIFARIGLLTIGGGYAMLPLLHKELVENYSWVSDDEILDYYAIGQSTPGIIAVNTATFVGMKLRGSIGAIVATIGMLTPSWFIISLISNFMDAFEESAVIQSAFSCMRIAVVALIISAIWKMQKSAIHSKADILLFLVGLAALTLIGISPVTAIICGGVYGVLVKLIKRRL